MALDRVTSFRISSSLEAPADGFDADLASSSTFAAAVAGEAVSLNAGLIKQDGAPVTYPQLDGLVDRYRLRIGHNGTTASVTGRDLVAKLLDRRVRRLYAKSRPDPVPFGIDEVIVGTFTASQVVNELIVSVGLTMAWECRDYTLREDFSAVGRIIDIVTRLTQPLNLTQMFKVDVWARGTTVYVKQRPGVIPVPDVVIDMQAQPRMLRAAEITVEKLRLPFIGLVVLRGMRLGGGPGGAIVLQPFVKVEERTIDTKDANGNLKSRTWTREEKQMPDDIMLTRHTIMYLAETGGAGLAREKEEFTEWQWTLGKYDTVGRRIAKPELLSEKTRVFGIVNTNRQWDQISEHHRIIGYDEKKRVRTDDETKFDRNPSSGAIDPTERTLKEYDEISNGMIEEITSKYSFDSTGRKWTMDNSVTQRNHGGLQQFGLSSAPGLAGGGQAGDQIQIEEIISTDPLAQDINFSDPNFDESDLRFLLEQLRAVSGKWEYELRIPQVAMPWVQKGMTILLTNIPLGRKNLNGGAFEAAQLLTLPAALITGRDFKYDESGSSPSMKAELIAKAWSAT